MYKYKILNRIGIVILCILISCIIGVVFDMKIVNDSSTIQFEEISNDIRFIFRDEDTTGIWKPVFHRDGSFIGFVIYDVNNTFKTFIHINETIKGVIN